MNGKIKRASELFSNNKNAKMAEQANITRASFMRMTSELSKPIDDGHEDGHSII